MIVDTRFYESNVMLDLRILREQIVETVHPRSNFPSENLSGENPKS